MISNSQIKIDGDEEKLSKSEEHKKKLINLRQSFFEKNAKPRSKPKKKISEIL